jgi:hypothetical protein
MTTRSCFRKLFARTPCTVRKASARFRPRVEALEAREVPANYTAANATELIAAITAANVAGEGGSDWFFALLSGTNQDKVKDQTAGEIITSL